jgi:hypothetical protein
VFPGAAHASSAADDSEYFDGKLEDRHYDETALARLPPVAQ